MPSEANKNEQKSPGWVSDLIHEFFVDLLGVLLPGMVFSILVAALSISCGACLLDAFRGESEHSHFIVALLGRQIDAPLVALLTIVGYVVGGTFFRQDPKVPDKASLRRILRGTRWSDHKRSEVQLLDSEKWKQDGKVSREEAAEIAGMEGAQFPYSHIRAYLETRGFNYLAKIVPWFGNKDEDGARSKMFINTLKIRLELAAPAKYGTIVRNEAHVRMMSSVWFAARTLITFCSLTTLPVLAAILRFCAGLQQDSFLSAIQMFFKMFITAAAIKGSDVNSRIFIDDLMIYLMLLFTAILSALWIKTHVERCFHYQRVREVFYVLETAFSVNKSSECRILDDLPRPVPKRGTESQPLGAQAQGIDPQA